jgi:PleD family two-component response regulator
MAVFLKWHWECNSEDAAGKQAIVPMIEEAVVRHDVLPMNLLVVDDEQYVRQLCADVAVQSGMKVTTVSTAEEAINILENVFQKKPLRSGPRILLRSCGTN